MPAPPVKFHYTQSSEVSTEVSVDLLSESGGGQFALDTTGVAEPHV